MKRPPLPLVEELPAALDPWEAFLRLSGLPWLVFFDSALRDSPLGRYSFIAADPFSTLALRQADARDPFPMLSSWLGPFLEPRGPSSEPPARLEEPERLEGLPPFRGGAAGLFGYGLSRAVEAIPPPRHDEFGLPDLAVGLYDLVLAFDHQRNAAWIISQGFPEREPEARARRALERLRHFQDLLRRPTPSPARADRSAAWKRGAGGEIALGSLAPSFPVAGAAGVLSSFSREGFESAVARGIEYVHAGDVFQVNLAQRLLAPERSGPLELYGRLRERNPAPLAGYFDGGGLTVASASPERFLRVEGDLVETRPIKGTRPRGRTPEDDRFARDELRQSGKDRAENIMIVDLLRNDLSRVCRPGSVTVPKLYQVESYQTVHHLVSEVRGRLREGSGPIDLLRASFPGGSVTGAPKVRAMEIIAELEPAARGAYCGSLGYIGFDGSMDTSILIRTVTAGRGWLQFPMGGGIVAGSVPEKEYAETLDKAAGILRALE